MLCIHQYPAGARPRGKSLDAVQHTSHMSCGQIGDPQTTLVAALLSLTTCISSPANRKSLPPWPGLIARGFRGASPDDPSTSLIYAPSWRRLQGSLSHL
jgi:hypothetical protein